MTVELLKELKEGFEKTFSDFKEANDKTLDTKSALNEEALDKVQTHLDKLEVDFKNVELSMKKDAHNDKANEYKEMTLSYMRTGKESFEGKGLIIGNASDGGYLTHPELDMQIVKNLTEVDGVRQYARVVTVGKGSQAYNKRTGLVTCNWVGEEGDVEESNSTYAKGEIAVHDINAMTPVSTRSLRDSDYNLEQEIATDISEAFAQKEGAGFIVGNNVSSPEGILTNDAIDRLTSGSSGVIDADDLLDLMFELKDGYEQGAIFGGNKRILKEIRKLKDDNGQYITQTAQDGRITYTVFGTPFAKMPSMVGASSAGKEVLFYGNLFKGYKILDRRGLTVLRDPYTDKKHKNVEFQFERSVGGGVVLPEAIKILKIKA